MKGLKVIHFMMRMSSDGHFDEASSVIKEVRTDNTVDVYYEYHMDHFPNSQQKGKMICYFRYEQPMRQKQRWKLTTLDGKSIFLDLLDGKRIDMGNGTTIVIGNSYDIFS